MDRPRPFAAGSDRRDRGEGRASRRFDGLVDAVLRGTGAGDRGPAAYYAPPIAPSFFAAFEAGHGDVWLLLEDRGAPTREQRFAEDLRRRYPEVKIRDASPILLAMREIKSDAELALIQRPVEVTVDAQKAAMARVLTATPSTKCRRRSSTSTRSATSARAVPRFRRSSLRGEMHDAPSRDERRSHRPRRPAAHRPRRRGRGLLRRRRTHLSRRRRVLARAAGDLRRRARGADTKRCR